MTMNKHAIPAILLFWSFSLNGQLTTYLTFEAGPQWGLIKVIDPGGYFESSNVNSSIAGITIGQEVTRNLSLVAGVYYQPYKGGINMIDDRPWTQRLATFSSLLITLRAEYRVQFTEFPVSLTPRIGYVFNRISFPDIPYQRAGILMAPDGSTFSYNQTQQFTEPSRHFLELGAALGLRFAGLWQASLNLSYLNGFNQVDDPTFLLSYQDPPGNATEAEYRTKGNQVFTTLSFHIPVSNIWQNRDYRIRSRIENSNLEGKPTESNSSFYLGAELGPLWRLFNTNNPAIGARPMEDRGFLRYANFRGGLYAGWLIRDDLGIDLGVNYQKSSIFYSISHDHEVDLAFRSTAPLFLEIPLRIRYFYNIYKEKLLYVVYGGASLLTQFSTGDFAAGSGDFSYTSPATGTQLQATSSYTATRISSFRPLLRIGTGAEYRLPLEFPLTATLYVNYMHGFMAVEEMTITGSIPGSASLGSLSYNGSAWSVDFGVKVPLPFRKEGACAPPPEREE